MPSYQEYIKTLHDTNQMIIMIDKEKKLGKKMHKSPDEIVRDDLFVIAEINKRNKLTIQFVRNTTELSNRSKVKPRKKNNELTAGKRVSSFFLMASGSRHSNGLKNMEK